MSNVMSRVPPPIETDPAGPGVALLILACVVALLTYCLVRRERRLKMEGRR